MSELSLLLQFVMLFLLVNFIIVCCSPFDFYPHYIRMNVSHVALVMEKSGNLLVYKNKVRPTLEAQRSLELMEI